MRSSLENPLDRAHAGTDVAEQANAESEHLVTQLLMDWGKGDDEALIELTPLVYAELRRLAKGCLRSEKPGHTLQPTALVHEAYLRMVAQSLPDWNSRSHFYGVAARLMRQVLVDHARNRQAAKRDCGRRVPLSESVAAEQDRTCAALALPSRDVVTTIQARHTWVKRGCQT